MKENSGIIYDMGDGSFGLALHKDQKPAFSHYGRIFYRIYIDAACTKPKLEPGTGKKLVGLRNKSQLKIIGYAD